MEQLLGKLKPDPDVAEWLVSQPVEVAIFPGQEVVFVLEDLADDASPQEFAVAVSNFLALTLPDRNRAAPHVFKNYAEFVDAVGPEDVDVIIGGPEHVWAHVHPRAVHVSRRHRRDRKVYVRVAAECDWEPEHGLQIVYRDGNELSRVSSQDGHLTHTDAYALGEDEDRIS